MKKRLLIVALVYAWILLSLAACSAGRGDVASQSPAVESAGEEASSGGGGKHLNFALFWIGDSMDHANGYNGWVMTRIGAGETLVRLNESVEVEPWLAESWELVDETTWVFHIREGIRFSNGRPVDAQAAMASIQRAFDHNDRAPGYFSMVEMRADGQALTIITKEPCAALLNNLAEPLFCIVDESDEQAIGNNTPACTGPYVITSYDYGNAVIELVKNESYWAGEPGLDSITVHEVVDSEARVMAMQSGEADLTGTIDNTSLSLFYGNDKYVVLEDSGLRTNVVFLNNESSFLKDVTLRRAISMAVDRDTYAQLIGGRPAVGFYSDSLPFGGDGLAGYSLDVEGANSLLDQTGYVDSDGDGIREMDGQNIALDYYQSADHGSSDASLLAQAIQSDLLRIGVQVTILSTENLSDVMAAGTFDMCSSNNNTAPTGDPQYFLSMTYGAGGSANTARYSSAAIEGILDQMLTEFDSTGRQQLARQAAQQLLDDAASLYLTYAPNTLVHSSRVKNVVCHPVDYYYITWEITVEG